MALALGNLGAAQAPADAVPSHATSSFQAPTASHSGSQAPAPAATASSSLSRDLQWRNIGPANMAGRVADIEALDADPATVLVASASGGVFKSSNAGTTWEPIFDKYGAASIGDIAIFQKDPNIIWVGTGESCVRNSVAWGDGVYKSTDGGKTFTNVGLRDTHHIGEVLTHPTDPNIAYVASQGHLWGYTGERGLFKTIDGGKTWQKLAGGLPDDGKTGATDVKMDPRNPNVLYVAMWQRIRHAYGFESGGPNGGIFKSLDAGKTWKKLTAGLPAGDIGKIGLSIYRRNPSIIVAIVEHGFQPARGSADYADMTKLGSGIYRSEDAGKTWAYINRYNERPFYYSHVYIDPTDERRVYALAAESHVSDDGGKTFSTTLTGIAGDFHAMWFDPSNGRQFYTGNDKGAYLTRDRGLAFTMFDNMAIGQFYAVTLDNRDPYWVYGGLQDNGNWGGPSNSRDGNGILNDHWFKFHSGDGFHTTVDPNDWRTVYTEGQGGNIRRLDAVFRQVGKSITPNPRTVLNFKQVVPDFKGPDLRLPAQFRFNWSAPLILSPHDSRTVYIGGNYLFRSADRGDTWTIISPDLSTNDPEKTKPATGGLTRESSGAETHCTIITVVESPIAPGSHLGRHRRWQRAGHARRREELVEREEEHPGRARRPVGEPRHAVALRRGDRLRHLRRPPERRIPAVRRQDRRLRQDVDEHRQRPARRPARLRHHGGPQESQPAVRRHRVRRLRRGGRRTALGAADERPADRGGARPGDSPARQRPGGRHARPQHLDSRRHHAAPATHARGDERRCIHLPESRGDDLARGDAGRRAGACAVHGAQSADHQGRSAGQFARRPAEQRRHQLPLEGGRARDD